MSLDDLKADAATMTRWQRHRFFMLVALVIVISLLLVSVGMSLYKMSGAEQVDLSRPGYQSIRKEAQRDTDNPDGFPASGELNDEVIKTFYSRYDKRSGRVVGVDSFDERALSEESLRLITAE